MFSHIKVMLNIERFSIDNLTVTTPTYPEVELLLQGVKIKTNFY